MADTETLYSLNYIAGELLNIDRKSIGEMVLRSYLAGNNMDKDESSIRNEDIRIDYNDEMKEELEITILGLIKSLRIAAFHSSEKR